MLLSQLVVDGLGLLAAGKQFLEPSPIAIQRRRRWRGRRSADPDQLLQVQKLRQLLGVALEHAVGLEPQAIVTLGIGAHLQQPSDGACRDPSDEVAAVLAVDACQFAPRSWVPSR